MARVQREDGVAVTPGEERRLLVRARDDAHRAMDVIGLLMLMSLVLWAPLIFWVLQ